MLLRTRCLVHSKCLLRRYASTSQPHALVFLEHHEGAIDSGSLSAITAAQQLGGQVTGLVLGGPDQIPRVVEHAKKCVL